MNVVRKLDADFHRSYRRKKIGRWHVRIFPDIFGVNAQQQLGHSGIAGNDQVGNLVGPDAGAFQQLGNNVIDIADDCLLQFFQAALFL